MKMASMNTTPNHEDDTSDSGKQDRNRPLNENFEAIDTGIAATDRQEVDADD